MMKKETFKFYCDECCKDSMFTRVKIDEETTVKDLTFINSHYYDKCEECGELFEPFEDYDVNYLSDYEMYCQKKGMLSYKEIKNIRELYELSQRDFAKLLAVSHATLSRIEKGEIPSEQHDVLFKLSSDPYSFLKNIVKTRGYLLKSDVLDQLNLRLKILISSSYEEHRKEFDEFSQKLNDKAYDLLIRLNKIEYTQSLQLNEKKSEDNDKEDDKLKWKKTSFLKKVGLFQ